MVDLDRREFLRIIGLAGTSTAAGCSSEGARRLIPYIIPPEDITPGESTWYATTCRECPAGCGMLAKNRDGRVIKVEGNPLDPIGGGRLCPRGQASLHGLYNPDRLNGPMVKDLAGKLESATWQKAEEALNLSLERVLEKGQKDRVVFMTDLINGSLSDLIHLWLSELGSPNGHIIYEPFAYESLRSANQIVFGTNSIPSYRIDKADFLISFNAGFLETWLSNVEYARQFASFHAVEKRGRNPFIFVGPRLSMTANNADLWISVPPGDEYLIALGMLRVILDGNLALDLDAAAGKEIAAMIDSWPMERIVGKTGVSEEVIRGVASRFMQAQSPLAIAEGLPFAAPNATATAVAANLLCTIKPGTRDAMSVASPLSYDSVAKAEELKALSERMRAGEIDLLLIWNANPLFSLPASWEFQRSLRAVPTVVSFTSFLDETSLLAGMVLPTDMPFESWGDYSPRAGVLSLMQPVMGRFFDTRHLGDILVSTGKRLRGDRTFPWKDFYGMQQTVWHKRWQEAAPQTPFETFWEEAVKRGGLWEEPEKIAFEQAPPSRFDFPAPEDGKKGSEGAYRFTMYPTVQFYDGRGANRPWIQELPDPMTQTTWGGWLEVHPETAKDLGVEKGQVIRVRSKHGSVEVPVLPIFTVPPGTLAMPIGQGHTAYGRYADGMPGNPMQLLPLDLDPASGGILATGAQVSVERTGKSYPIANTDGSFYDFDREIVETVTMSDYRGAVESGEKPHLYLPLPEGYDPKKDFYPSHEHVDYRWAMVVDLDRCIGCSACVVACYAENNVPTVGREQVLKGREMSWLRIQRYFEKGKLQARWLPMLCQHCDNAPCESVCPIYAPHHSKEGLNNQVYNRCFGTRFCSQNDPYKVRRFNWFTFSRPESLRWQLNPDVTVRQKGVMEKCSFCVQRIIEAKIKARNEGRKVRDGDFTTACAQTCPTNVFTFGSLLDPNSRVSRMIRDPRTYQVLAELNTKPAVFYLKKVTEELPVVKG